MSTQTQKTPVDTLSTWAVADGLVPLVETPAELPLDRLLAAFDRHITSEADTVAAYRELAERTADPVVALLMRQVVDDEERHHGMLRSMAARLRDTLERTHSLEAVPTRGTPSEAQARPWRRCRNSRARSGRAPVRRASWGSSKSTCTTGYSNCCSTRWRWIARSMSASSASSPAACSSASPTASHRAVGASPPARPGSNSGPAFFMSGPRERAVCGAPGGAPWRAGRRARPGRARPGRAAATGRRSSSPLATSASPRASSPRCQNSAGPAGPRRNSRTRAPRYPARRSAPRQGPGRARGGPAP